MPAPKKDPSKRFVSGSITLPPELWQQIEMFRVKEGLYSKSEAIRSLLKKAGLKEK